MSVAVEAETEAPSLHDLVTKKEGDGFVWDHQFTVSMMCNIHVNVEGDNYKFNHSCPMQNLYFNLDDGWRQLFCLNPYIIGNWKVNKERRNQKICFSKFRLVYMGVKKEDKKEEI